MLRTPSDRHNRASKDKSRKMYNSRRTRSLLKVQFNQRSFLERSQKVKPHINKINRLKSPLTKINLFSQLRSTKTIIPKLVDRNAN